MLGRKTLIGLAVTGFAYVTTMSALHPMRTVTPPPAVTVQHVQFTQAECDELGSTIRLYESLQRDIERERREAFALAVAHVFGFPQSVTLRMANLNNYTNRQNVSWNLELLNGFRADCPDTPVSP